MYFIDHLLDFISNKEIIYYEWMNYSNNMYLALNNSTLEVNLDNFLT